VWLVPLSSIAKKRGADDPRAIGGKASRQAWLVRHGFMVPDAWVLPVDAFAHAAHELPPVCDPKALLRAATTRSGAARAAEARELLLNAPMPKGLEAELEALWEREKGRSPWGFAVRSSATCEDGTIVSMAGLADSILGVRGVDGLVRAIREVWASIASGRALAYLSTHGVREVGMALLIQRVVPAEAAGVMFTHMPGSRTNERVINCAFGLGVPVANGVLTPDMLRVDEQGRIVDEMIADKPFAMVVGESGLVRTDVADPRRPSLDQAHITALAEIATRIERIERGAWDVEFACDPEATWVLQARPATGRGFPEGGDEHTVWSRANVGEALPGVATPLTWSVAGAFSEGGFKRAFASLGCTVPRGATLVASVHGRFYLNATQFMRIAAQVPWLNPKTLVELAGGSGGDELEHQVANVSHTGFYARLPMTALRLGKEQLRLDDEIARFEKFAERAVKAHSALDLAILPDEGVARKVRDVQGLLERTGHVMLTCGASALGTHLALKALLARVAPIGAERLAQALTTGIRDLESARPAIGLMRVVNLARLEPGARTALEREDIAGLDALPDGPTRRALSSFLELYGDRAVREAELSTPRWREDARPVLAMVRVALRGEAPEIEAVLARSRAHADGEMQKILPRLGIVEQTIARHLVARAQKAARLREQMRAWVTRVLGMIREVVLDADRRLLRLAPDLEADRKALAASGSSLVHVHDAFFLTVDELATALWTSKVEAIVPLVRARRAEHARDVARPDPPVTFIGSPSPIFLPPGNGDQLLGLPASGGVIEGRARVLRGPEEISSLMPGEVLVVRTTDVGWTPLFFVAAGIVTELGGPLSHAAIVARELGVPTVVNVAGATQILRTGDIVRLDGDRGVVERIR
jgi:pyruvate,water dikinase